MNYVVDAKGRLILSGCFILNERKELLLLHRKDHDHYETPGGKVDVGECKNPDTISEEELLKTAQREVYEELGRNIILAPLQYFGSVEFIIPDGRLAIANKFLTSIVSGKPELAEPHLFDALEYIKISDLDTKPLSPDLKLFLKQGLLQQINYS